MKDFVRSAIARNLQVSEHSIALWRITVGAGSRSDSRGGSAPTQLEAQLEVTLAVPDQEAVKALERRFTRSSSVVINHTTVGAHDDFTLSTRLYLDVTLCYGKDTQHIFKALHQTMTVRGRQKGKR